MANDFKGGNKKPMPKMGMISELRKGTKFVHPHTEEITFVNFKDEDCLGVGSSNGYTTNYIRTGDELWSAAVELR